LGQEQTFNEAIPMSAVPPIADIGRTSVDLPPSLRERQRSIQNCTKKRTQRVRLSDEVS
jgi:hypothetical protein